MFHDGCDQTGQHDDRDKTDVHWWIEDETNQTQLWTVWSQLANLTIGRQILPDSATFSSHPVIQKKIRWYRPQWLGGITDTWSSHCCTLAQYFSFFFAFPQSHARDIWQVSESESLKTLIHQRALTAAFVMCHTPKLFDKCVTSNRNYSSWRLQA